MKIMMDKQLLKEYLQELIEQQIDIRIEMEKLIYSYLMEKGDIEEGHSPENIAYKKILREEFDLVV